MLWAICEVLQVLFSNMFANSCIWGISVDFFNFTFQWKFHGNPGNPLGNPRDFLFEFTEFTSLSLARGDENEISQDAKRTAYSAFVAEETWKSELSKKMLKMTQLWVYCTISSADVLLTRIKFSIHCRRLIIIINLQHRMKISKLFSYESAQAQLSPKLVSADSS